MAKEYECASEEKFKLYKLANKEAKRAVNEANYEAYDTLYAKLGSKEGETDIY